MDAKYLLFIALIVSSSCLADSSRILGIFWTSSRSHHILGTALLQALAKKGHDVTLLTPFIDDVNIPTFRQIKLELGGIDGSLSAMTDPNTTMLQRIQMFIPTIRQNSEKFWENKAVQELIKTKEKYDVIISINCFNDGILALNHHLGAPTIVFNPSGTSSLVNKYLANPNLPYSINVQVSAGRPDSFSGRLISVAVMSLLSLMDRFIQNPVHEEVMLKYLPNSPPVSQLQKNISLVFVNSHHSIEAPRPYVPNMIQLGGFYAQNVEKLPDDLQKYLDSAKDGAVLFGLGTNVKLASFDKGTIDAILKGLGRLAPMKVLFKSDIKLSNVPKNIMVTKGFPQNDVLAHPNIRAFITHGGLGGVTESIFHGVPMIGIPFFADQKTNVATAKDAGYAKELFLEDITHTSFQEALNEVLNNPKYAKEAKKRSKILRNQPVKSLDNAIWWVEHIIEFKGGDHLKNIAVDLEWYELYMVDIMFFCFVLLLLLSVSSFFITRFLFKKIVGDKNEKLKKA